MGANSFLVTGKPGDLELSFSAEAEVSRWQDGSDYSGCIGMKDTVVKVTEQVFETEAEAIAYADRMLDDPRVNDKWGPAGAVQFRAGWVFFGWASS